jgi:hypothetical protein
MTSRFDGLKALATTEGYAHHSYIGLHKSTLSGCPLCIVLQSTGFTKFLARKKSRKRVRVFAIPSRSKGSSEPSIFYIQALIFDAGGKQKLRLEASLSKGSSIFNIVELLYADWLQMTQLQRFSSAILVRSELRVTTLYNFNSRN